MTFPDEYLGTTENDQELVIVSQESSLTHITWVIRDGLSGIASTISFESKSKPGYFLRQQFFRMKLHLSENSTLFAEDPSFMVLSTGIFNFIFNFIMVGYVADYIRVLLLVRC